MPANTRVRIALFLLVGICGFWCMVFQIARVLLNAGQ